MWTQANHDQAKAEGWRLVTTFNLGDSHPMYDVASFEGSRLPNDQTAVLAVIEMAKRGSTLHQQALKLVIASRAKPQPKTKGKR